MFFRKKKKKIYTLKQVIDRAIVIKRAVNVSVLIYIPDVDDGIYHLRDNLTLLTTKKVDIVGGKNIVINPVVGDILTAKALYDTAGR